MSPTVIRIGIGVLLAIGTLVHGLHLGHPTRENLLLKGLDVVIVAAGLTLLASMFRRGEKGEAAAGWAAVGVGAMLLLALVSL